MTDELLKNHLPKNKINGVDYESYSSKIKFILLTGSDHEFNAAATYLHSPSIEGHVQDAKDTATSLQQNIVIGTFAGGPIALIQTSKEKNMNNFFETVLGIFPDAKYIISTGTGFAVQQKEMKLGDVFISSGVTVIDDYSVNIDDSMAYIHIQGSHMHTIDFLQTMFCFDSSVPKKFEVTEIRVSDYQISDIISGIDLSEDSRLYNKTSIIVDLNAVGGDVNGRELMQLQNEGKIKGFIVIKSVTEYIDSKKKNIWKFTGAMAAVHYVEQKMIPYNYHVTSMDQYMSELKSGDMVNVMVAKLIFLGPPMQGKTVTRQRLTKAMKNLSSSDHDDKSNTGVSEQTTVIICKDMLSATALAIDDDNWTTVDVKEPNQSPNFSSTGCVQSEHPRSQASFEKKENTGPTSAEISAFSLDWSKNILGTLTNRKIYNFEHLKKKLDKGYLLYMQDIGGPPELMECLPALTIGPALYLLFCKLTSRLDDTYKIGYRGPDGTTLPIQSHFTMKETLLSALASVASMGYSSTDQDTDIKQQVTNREGCVYLIGTHRDEVKTIEAINHFESELHKVLESTFFYEKGLIKWWYEEDMPPESGLFSKDIDARLVYPLDNKFGENKEMACLRSSIHKRLNKLFANQKIPTNWLVFGICLRQSEESIVTLENCFELGLQLNMTKDVTRAALHFLHYNLGICMHFSNIPALKDLVIPNTQVIYKNLTTLIEAAFKPSKVVPRATRLFKKTGQFSIEKFKAISDFSLPLKTLVVILEHLNIIAPVSSDHSEEGMFFMPCILQNASDDEITTFEKDNPIPQGLTPLFIRYDCGFVPIGVFSSMVANLMQATQKTHTDIALKLKPDNLKRNHVQFWNGRDIITFIHKPEHIRIHISQLKKCEEKLYEVCPKLRNLVKNTLGSIAESMLNSLYTATSEEQYKSHFQTYQFAFKCYEHSQQDHLCVVSHEDIPETMNCVWDGNKTRFEVRAENLIWYGKKLSPSKLPSSEVEIPIYSATMTDELLKNHLPKNKINGVDYESYCKKIEFILLTGSDHEFNAAATYLHSPSIEGHVQDAKDTATSLQPNIIVGTFAGGPIALIQTSKEKNMNNFFETVLGIFPDAKYIISTGTGFAVQQKEMKLGDVFISSGVTVIDDYSVNIDDSIAYIHIQGSHMHTIDFLQTMFCFDSSVPKKFEVTEFRAADYQISDIISGVDLSEDSRLDNKTSIIVDLNAVGGDVNGRELMHLQNERKIKGFIVIKSVTEYIDSRKDNIWKFTGAIAAVNYVEQKMIPYNYHVTSVDHYMSALESGDVVNVMVAKLIFLGPSMQGKTVTRQRLTKAIKNISSSDIDKSNTGVSEQTTVIICKDMLSATALAIDDDNWITVDVEEETQFCLNVSKTETEQVAEHSSNSQQLKDRSTPEEPNQSPNFSSTGCVQSEHPCSQASFEKKENTGPTSAEISAFNLDWSKNIVGTLTKRKIYNLEHLQKKLDKGYLLYMQDTGGQTELMECLPVLTIGPALHLLFCKLTSRLDDTYKIGYRGPDGTTLPIQSHFTMKETLLSALASVASMGYSLTDQDTDIKQQVTNREGCVYLIGTHRDEVKTIEAINHFESELHKVLESTFFYKKDLIKCWYEKDMPPESGLFSKDIDARLVYPLDNKYGKNKEMEYLRKSIHKRLNNLFANQKIPTNWLVFGICLRRREKSIVTLESCFDLGLRLNMTKDVTRAALHFLHYNLGICMHFSNIPALKDRVIPNTQAIYKNLTTLIEAAFKPPSKVVPRATRLFKKTGQFSIEKFKAATDFSLPLETLVVILEHLNIIAQVSSNDSEETMFFMPCILQNASDDEITTFEKENPIPQGLTPLFIRYNCGFVPLGVFSSMVANLMQQATQKKAHTDIALILKPDNLKRNHVQFWNGCDIITFVHTPEHIKIHISQQKECDERLYKVCPKIRNLVKNTLGSITESMLNSLYTATSEDRYKSHFQTYQFAFKCYEHSQQDHLCVVSHEDIPETMNCVSDGNNTPFEMRAENLIWYGKKLSPSKLSAGEASIPTIGQLSIIEWVNEHGQTQTLRILEDVCSKWRDIGDLIGLSLGRLESIDKDRRGISADCCRDAFCDWLKQEEGRRYPVSWDGVCQLLKNIKLSTVAKQIDEWQNSTH